MGTNWTSKIGKGNLQKQGHGRKQKLKGDPMSIRDNTSVTMGGERFVRSKNYEGWASGPVKIQKLPVTKRGKEYSKGTC